MKRREREIQRSGIRWLKGQGCVCIKIQKLYKYGVKGWPDYVVVQPPGKVWFPEYKVPGEDPTPLQAERHAEIRAAGGIVYVLHSKEETQIAWAEMEAL